MRVPALVLGLVCCAWHANSQIVKMPSESNRDALLAAIPVQATASFPAVAIDPAGNVIVAWTQGITAYTKLYLHRWRGGAWEALASPAPGGGVDGARGEALVSSLALDSAGNPAIAWQDRSMGANAIYFRRWDGSTWQELEGSASSGGVSMTTTGYSGFPSLALDSRGLPVVAWEEHYGSRADIYVRRYERRLLKQGWEDVGDHPGVVGFQSKLSEAIQPALRLNPQGRPSVAWLDSETGPKQVYFRRWNGSRWEELAGSATQGGVSRSREVAASVDMELDAEANPILSWKEGSGPGATAVVKHWNGKQWESMGETAAAPGVDPTWPRLALDAQRRPVLAYRAEDKIHVRRWTGTVWEMLGSANWHNPHVNHRPDERQFALAAGADKVCAAWIEEGDSPALQVACFRLGSSGEH